MNVRWVFALVWVAVTVESVALAAADDDKWRRLPPLPGRAGGGAAVALEEDTLWVKAGITTAYWDNKTWQLPAGPALKSGTYVTQFYGGGDRPLYFSQATEREKTGALYRVSGKGSEFQTEFHFDTPYEFPRIHVTKSGQIVNLTKAVLSVYGGEAWNKTPVPQVQGLVFETDERTYVFYPLAQRLFHVDRENVIRENILSLPWERQKTPNHGVLWGNDRLLLYGFSSGGKPLAFSLASGEPVDVSRLNDQLEKRQVFNAFRTRDGSAWLILNEGMPGKFSLLRVRPDSSWESLELPTGPWSEWRFSTHPESVLETKSGEIWLGGQVTPITRIHDGQVTQFGAATGFDLRGCTHLVEHPTGTVYAAKAGGGVYAYYAASDPPANLQAPQKPDLPGEAQWVFRREQGLELAAAWKVRETVFVTARDGQSLIAIDARTGEVRFRTKLVNEQIVATPWLIAQPSSDVIEFATPRKVVRVETDGGAVQEPIDLARDTGIPPVAIEGGYLIVPQPRGRTVRRVDKEGHAVWECPLPGYAMRHPTVLGKLAIYQTRGESYGGQQTICLDLDSGKIRWSEVMNAYGQGAAFFDDETFVVEADSFMSPEKSEAWLVCREPQTGHRRWHYRYAGGGFSHPPLVDRKTARVYAVTGGGHVVCLRGEDGSVVWEKSLSEPALTSGSGNAYYPAWSPHSLRGNRLLVVDRNLVWHAFDAKAGERLASVALAADGLFAHARANQLVAPPWLTDEGSLIAAFSEGVVAYSVPRGLEGR